MGFPFTNILDNFNRANEGPPMTGWADDSTDNGLQVVSNACKATSVALTGVGDAYWNKQFNADQEAYMTVSTIGTEIYLGIRVSNPATFSSVTGYFLDFSPTGWQIARVDAGFVETTLTTGLKTISNGDSVGISAVGTLLTAWYKSGSGAWTILGTYNISADTTQYNSAGYSIIYLLDTVSIISNFGGGNVSVPTFQQAATPVIAPTSGTMYGSIPTSGLTAKDLFILQVVVDNLTTTVSTPTGLSLLYGPDANANARQYVFGALASGSESGTYAVSFGSDASVVKMARMYRFRGTSIGTYFEAGAFGTGAATGSTYKSPSFTTVHDADLGVVLGFIVGTRNSNNLTGEAGAVFNTAVISSTSTLGNKLTIDIQTGGVAYATGVTSGTYTYSGAASFLSRAFGLIRSNVLAVATPATQAINIIINSVTASTSGGGGSVNATATPSTAYSSVIIKSVTAKTAKSSTATLSEIFTTVKVNSPSVNISRSSSVTLSKSYISVVENSPIVSVSQSRSIALSTVFVSIKLNNVTVQTSATKSATVNLSKSFVNIIINPVTASTGGNRIVNLSKINISILTNSPNVTVSKSTTANASLITINIFANSPSVKVFQSKLVNVSTPNIKVMIFSPTAKTSTGATGIVTVYILLESKIEKNIVTNSRISPYINGCSGIETSLVGKSKIETYLVDKSRIEPNILLGSKL